MNVQDIIKKYLEDNGYEGLYNPDDSCGCGKDDLFPCTYGSPCECKPGYRCKLDIDDNEYWEADEWGFGPNKEATDDQEK